MINRNFVIDSSVYVKLLVPEEDSEQAEGIFAKIVEQGSYILVPSIFLCEVIGVFRKYSYDQVTIEDFVANYYNIPCIKIFNLEREIISKALEISKEGSEKTGSPSFYDASYHALAILNGCDFITADRRHYEKTKMFGHVKLLADM